MKDLFKIVGVVVGVVSGFLFLAVCVLFWPAVAVTVLYMLAVYLGVIT